MFQCRASLLAAFLSLWSSADATSFDFDSACSNIASQVTFIANVTTVSSSDLVPAGTNLTFNQDPQCVIMGVPTSQVTLVDMCRVALNVSTSNRSAITMEAWLPRNWTGRFLSTGNGGLDGCIQYYDLAYTTALGFATVGANNGHDGIHGQQFYGNPDILADYVYRSIHTNVVVGKEITELFYGSPHNKSYYLGCSTGGRQGFKSVQDFPDDFDGVLAGSPVINFNNLISWMDRFFSILGTSNSLTFLTADQWTGLIHDNILKQCDTIDGVADNVIEDPNLCDYKPEELICSPGSNSLDCLTPIQASAVRQVFTPLYGLNGQLMFPRQQPGGENILRFVAEPFAMYAGGQGPIFYASDWYHYVVYNPSFDITKLNLTDYQYAEELNPFNVSTFNSDLSAFKERNGKVITYHGQADIIVTPRNTELYYDNVAQTMGLPPTDIDDFMRFFRISGMSHCSDGDGAWEFGQGLDAVTGNLTGEGIDPERNILMALVKWVEEDIAPDTILGTKYIDDTVENGVAFSRRHCRYPLRNVYNGTGDSSNPDSWSCQ